MKIASVSRAYKADSKSIADSGYAIPTVNIHGGCAFKIFDLETTFFMTYAHTFKAYPKIYTYNLYIFIYLY